MRSIKIQFLVIVLLVSGTLQSQWVRTNGPNGGHVAEFGISGSSIFTGSIDGIFKSTDAGVTWIRVSDLGAFTISVNGTTIFAGGSEILVRSTDNGNSWVDITGNIAVNHITSQLYVHNGILFVGTSGAGVYKSTNNGNSFQAVNNGFGAFAFISSFTSSGNLLFTGLTGNGGTVGVYVTFNEGESWNQVVNGLPVNRMSTQCLTVSGSDIFAGVNDQGIYKSTNSGGSWFAVNTGLPLVVGGGVNVIEANGGIIYAGRGGEGAWRSTNNGNSWNNISNGLPVQTSPLSFFITDTYVLIGSQYAVYKSNNNGDTWFASYKGIANTLVTDLITYGNNIYAATMPGNNGYGEGVSVTPDGGENWSDANGGFPGNISVNTLAFNGSTLFAGTIWATYKTTNFGISWKNVDSTNNGAGVEKIIVVNNTVFAGTYGNGIKKSTDNGQTWYFSNNGLGNDAVVLDLMVNGSNIYAGIFWGVYVSTDNGANWINKSAGIYPGSSVYCLAKSGNNLLAGSDNGVYLSSNDGTSWISVTSEIPTRVNDLTISGGYVYAASENGVYQSSDHGLSWSEFNSGLSPNTKVISIVTLNNNIYIGTNGKGVWKQLLPGILTLNLKALIQGFYDPLADKAVKDTASVYLRNSSSPYSIIGSALSVIDSNGMGSFIFTNAVNSVPYYIVIKHRNGLETWSATGNSFNSGNLSYDFTIAASRAYGNNQILRGTKYCLYNGDVNQDRIIDGSDMSQADNDAFSFLTGYLSTDVNGDNIVDATDLVLIENNALNFIGIQRP